MPSGKLNITNYFGVGLICLIVTCVLFASVIIYKGMASKQTVQRQPEIKTDTILINEFKTLSPDKITDPEYRNKLCLLSMLIDEHGDLTNIEKDYIYLINWSGSSYMFTFINDSVLIVKSK